MDDQWKIFLLMDHREFQNTKNNFAPRAKNKIDNHFKGKHTIDAVQPEYCERTHLISGDYMFVARKFDASGSQTDERVLDLVVERKSVDDLQGCLIKKSKTCAPLSFFEAQMFKLQQTPGNNRIFLMEGDEDKPGENGISQVGNPGEWVLRRKRVKTMRNQIRGDEWKGVKLVCTTDKNHSVQYLVDKMAEFMKEGFDPTRLHLYKTMEEYKQIVNERMKDATFLEYLRLRKMKGTGDVTAMKAIKNPDGPWNKDFISPACISRDRKYKSNLEDRADYYVSNNVGGMSKKGNAILNAQTSSTSAASANNIPRKSSASSSAQNSGSSSEAKSKTTTETKSSSTQGCKKCTQELQTGQKNNLRHAASCPKKTSAKRHSSGSYDGNQYKKKIKPTEAIYVNPNPARRSSLIGGDIDRDLIMSIHSTRRDLTGGSGLGIGGFELSAARAKTNISTSSQPTRSSVQGWSQTSSSRSSCREKPSRTTVSRNPKSDECVAELLDSPDSTDLNAKKPASVAVAATGYSHAVDDVIVLDDSEDEGLLDSKTPPKYKNTVADVEVIEID